MGAYTRQKGQGPYRVDRKQPSGANIPSACNDSDDNAAHEQHGECPTGYVAQRISPPQHPMPTKRDHTGKEQK